MGSKNQPAGSTTSTGTSAPWAPQQPYLESIFGNAQNLYNTGGPQYYPSSTYSAFNPEQLNSLSAIENQAPYTQYQAGLANQANTALAGGSTNATNPGITSGVLQGLGSTNLGLNNPGVGTLENFSSGDYLNGGAANPYTQALSQSVLSSVVPSIENRICPRRRPVESAGGLCNGLGRHQRAGSIAVLELSDAGATCAECGLDPRKSGASGRRLTGDGGHWLGKPLQHGRAESAPSAGSRTADGGHVLSWA